MTEHKPGVVTVPGETTIVDIYEAMGGTANEDRTKVTMDPSKNRPFDIKLRVFPTALETGMDGEFVTLGVLLHDDTYLGATTAAGTPMSQIYHDVSIRLPVHQVDILKKPAAYDGNGDMSGDGKRFRQVGWRITGGVNDGLIVALEDGPELEHRLKDAHGGYAPIYMEVGD